MGATPFWVGGIAAVLILGIGLLATGEILAGASVLILGVLAMAIALSPSMSGKALFVAIGTFMAGMTLGYQAASNELTGTATYRTGFSRGSRSEEVTREGSPDKFRDATNPLWAGSILCVLAGSIAFVLSRKLDDCAADF